MRLWVSILCSWAGATACIGSDGPNSSGRVQAPGATPDQESVLLDVVTGWNDKDKEVIDPQGELRFLQMADEDWWSQEAGYFSAFLFDVTALPADREAIETRIVIEHWEEDEVMDGDITLSVATGSLDFPDVIDSTLLPVVNGRVAQDVFTWPVAADPEGLIVVVANDNPAGQKALINLLYLDVVFAP